MLIQRVEAGVHLQQGTAGAYETAKGGGTFGAMRQVLLAKIAKQQLENLELELGDATVIDERRGAQLLQSAGETCALATRARAAAQSWNSGTAGTADVQQIEKMPVRCAVRACPRGSAGASACRGFNPMKPAPRGRQPANQGFEIAKITDSPVVAGAHRVKLHRHAPQAPALLIGLVALGRRDERASSG